MASAALEKELDDVGRRLLVLGMEVRRPADDVELVDVTEAVHVTTGVQERAHDLDVPAGGRPVQRIGVVACLTSVRIRAVGEQEARRLQLTMTRRRVQRRPSAVRLISVCSTNERWIRGDQLTHALDVAPGAGGEEYGEPLVLAFRDLSFERAPA